MFNLPIDNPDIICPSCRRPMVDLAGYDLAVRRDVERTDGFRPKNRAGIPVFLFLGLLNWLTDSAVQWLRIRKVDRLCRQELPPYPKSLICPSCLSILRRK